MVRFEVFTTIEEFKGRCDGFQETKTILNSLKRTLNIEKVKSDLPESCICVEGRRFLFTIPFSS